MGNDSTIHNIASARGLLCLGGTLAYALPILPCKDSRSTMSCGNLSSRLRAQRERWMEGG